MSAVQMSLIIGLLWTRDSTIRTSLLWAWRPNRRVIICYFHRLHMTQGCREMGVPEWVSPGFIIEWPVGDTAILLGCSQPETSLELFLKPVFSLRLWRVQGRGTWATALSEPSGRRGRVSKDSFIDVRLTLLLEHVHRPALLCRSLSSSVSPK